MPSHAEEHSYTIDSNRNCTMEITNLTDFHLMINPDVYMESGKPYSPPQPTLAPGSVEICSFTKEDTFAGAVGVMTYDLHNTRAGRSDGTMAVLFSVPYDYNCFCNVLGVGIFDAKRKCDNSLYETMYEGNKERKDKKPVKDSDHFQTHNANGSSLTFRNAELEIRACMNNEGRGIIKMEVYDRMGRVV